MITAAHSTIDMAEPARDIERAAEIFAHSEGAIFPPEAISNLRLRLRGKVSGSRDFSRRGGYP